MILNFPEQFEPNTFPQHQNQDNDAIICIICRSCFRITVREVFVYAVIRPHVGYMNIFVRVTVPTHLRVHYGSAVERILSG